MIHFFDIFQITFVDCYLCFMKSAVPHFHLQTSHWQPPYAVLYGFCEILQTASLRAMPYMNDERLFNVKSILLLKLFCLSTETGANLSDSIPTENSILCFPDATFTFFMSLSVIER